MMLRQCIGAIAGVMCGISMATTFSVGGIQIEHPWTFDSPPGAKVGGAFMTLNNRGKEPDRLIRASTPIAGTTEIHTHLMENGVMKMRAIPHIVIESGGTVTLKPGSFHLMFFDLKKPVASGDKFPVTLEFERAGRTTVDVIVEGRTGGTKPDHAGHKH